MKFNVKIKDMIKLVKGDITELDVDAIVNAANRSLLGGGGVDGAIHDAAGPELFDECLTLGGCNFGEAKITKGYKLKTRHVIHTVGPIYNSRIDQSSVLASCYKNSLNLVKENELHSIAFPAISTGVYGYPLKEATKIAIATVKEWLKNNNYEIDVIFVAFDQRTYETYNALLS